MRVVVCVTRQPAFVLRVPMLRSPLSSSACSLLAPRRLDASTSPPPPSSSPPLAY